MVTKTIYKKKSPKLLHTSKKIKTTDKDVICYYIIHHLRIFVPVIKTNPIFLKHMVQYLTGSVPNIMKARFEIYFIDLL